PGGSRTSPSTVARVEGLVSRWHLPGSTNALEAAKAKSLHQLNRAIAQLKPEVGAAGSIGFTRTTSIWGGFAVVAWVGCVVDCAATASDHATAPSNVMNCDGCSFDHLVGASEQRGRHFEAEGLGGPQIDGQQELGRLQNGQFSRFRAFENASDVAANLTIAVGEVDTVA